MSRVAFNAASVGHFGILGIPLEWLYFQCQYLYASFKNAEQINALSNLFGFRLGEGVYRL